MRTEIRYVRHARLRRRVNYMVDMDGKHAKAGLVVQIKTKGMKTAAELFGVVRSLRKNQKRRGPKLRYVACEITAHPVGLLGAKSAFNSTHEMDIVATELLEELHAVYALICYHGLQDIHLLIVNRGPTGLALKSYLPNRTNPRRVMVAVADRIEGELNATRAAQGLPLMFTMEQVRAKRRKGLEVATMVASHLPADRGPSVTELLRAVARCGWCGVVRRRRLSVQFSPDASPRHYELDLFLRSVSKALACRRSLKKRGDGKDLTPDEPILSSATVGDSV